jgi:surface antigen
VNLHFHGRGQSLVQGSTTELIDSGQGGATGQSCDSQGICFTDDPFSPGQCTWYAEGRRPDLLGIVHGNAGSWLHEASGRVPEGSVPVVGALAVWLPYHPPAGEFGHVGYVAAVRGSEVLIDDSNWAPTWAGPWLLFHEHWERASSPSGYIYGGPAGNGPGSPPTPPKPAAGSTFVMLSTGSGFSAPQEWSGTPFYGSKATLMGDVNGDGKADLIAVNEIGSFVMLSTGSSFSAVQGWSGERFFGSAATLDGDVNGDGQTDLVAVNYEPEIA